MPSKRKVWAGKMFDLTKREILIIIGALVIICGLTAWGTVFVIQKYVIGERDDPIARAGGLRPSQATGRK
jgi:hypothetical protein